MPYRNGNGSSAPIPGYKGVYGSNKSGTRKPVLEKTKSVSYSATTSDQIFAISASAEDNSSESMPNKVEVENTGGVPLMIMTGYQEWSSDTAESAGTEYIHTMIMPGETYSPPVRAIIRTGESSVIIDGTVVDNAAPDSNEYVATGSGCSDLDNTTDPVTFTTVGARHRVGDLIRVENEVMEVTAISGDDVTVKRGLFGSTTASHSDGVDVRYPFFNAYHDFDKYSVAQTDSNGKFKCMNFFGAGRTASGVQGITPGSVAIKFYNPGYQSLGLSGINGNTNSGLTASTAYKIDITVDGGTLFQDLTFTTDSSNLNFGGGNGIIAKIQSALDTQYYTAGNLFEKAVSVAIVNGDIRFTSGSSLSTSAILLADTGDSGSFIDAAANGRIPASGNIPAAVAARLPDDSIYDPVTYVASPNSGAFCYDDGLGRLFGAASGSINYETGAIDFRTAPPNAEFVHSVLHTSAFSGKLNESTTDRVNSLVDIRANATSQKWNGSIKVRTW